MDTATGSQGRNCVNTQSQCHWAPEPWGREVRQASPHQGMVGGGLHQRQRFPTRRSWIRAVPTNIRVHLGAHPPVRTPWGVFMAVVEWSVGPSGKILGRREGKRKRKKCVGGNGDCKLPQLIYSVWYHIDTKAPSPNCFNCSGTGVQLETRYGPCWHQASVQAALRDWRLQEGRARPTSCLLNKCNKTKSEETNSRGIKSSPII